MGFDLRAKKWNLTVWFCLSSRKCEWKFNSVYFSSSRKCQEFEETLICANSFFERFNSSEVVSWKVKLEWKMSWAQVRWYFTWKTRWNLKRTWFRRCSSPAKANSVELNFCKTDSNKAELSVSLAIRARKRNNFKRKRSPWQDYVVRLR